MGKRCVHPSPHQPNHRRPRCAENGELSVRALAAYTSKRVRELTAGSQRPVFVCLGKAADFEILPTVPGSRPKSPDDLLGTQVSGYRIGKVLEDAAEYQLYAAGGDHRAVIRRRSGASLRVYQPAWGARPACGVGAGAGALRARGWQRF